jgi:hypothetical protein
VRVVYSIVGDKETVEVTSKLRSHPHADPAEDLGKIAII